MQLDVRQLSVVVSLRLLVLLREFREVILGNGIKQNTTQSDGRSNGI